MENQNAETTNKGVIETEFKDTCNKADLRMLHEAILEDMDEVSNENECNERDNEVGIVLANETPVGKNRLGWEWGGDAVTSHRRLTHICDRSSNQALKCYS